MERRFLELCEKNGPCWHLFTPGKESENIFRCREDFVFGMNMCGLSAAKFKDVTLYTFELMNNHHHFLISGHQGKVVNFFESYQKRLFNYLNMVKGYGLKDSRCSLRGVDNLQSFKNELIYINRNGYVVDKQTTPFSYPWGANMFFFGANRYTEENLTLCSSMSLRKRRALFHSHDISSPPDYYMFGEYIHPRCYCHIDEAESVFYSAHDYFSHLTKSVESYKEIALGVGDSTFLTDNELYNFVRGYCIREYGKSSVLKLSDEERLAVAKMLHFDYKSGNSQISRILRVDLNFVNSIFPLSKR